MWVAETLLLLQNTCSEKQAGCCLHVCWSDPTPKCSSGFSQEDQVASELSGICWEIEVLMDGLSPSRCSVAVQHESAWTLSEDLLHHASWYWSSPSMGWP